jgi:hypothetical protein
MLSPPTTPPTQHQQQNATVNTQKDLPASSPIPRNGNATSAFWGGQPSSILGGAGGITPVHTALVPEIHVGLWGNAGAAGTKKILGENNGNAGMNMNPLLNLIGAGAGGDAVVGEKIKGVEKINNAMMVPGGLSGFDAFADSNLFTMKSLDAYVVSFPPSIPSTHHIHGPLDIVCSCGVKWLHNIMLINLQVLPVNKLLLRRYLHHLYLHFILPLLRLHHHRHIRDFQVTRLDYVLHSFLLHYSPSNLLLPLRRRRLVVWLLPRCHHTYPVFQLTTMKGKRRRREKRKLRCWLLWLHRLY